MARLNEVPHSTDSYDTLRRKLLRQNRELARVNSTQSLRIRHLENECARMLSENLDLRGQILSLEKEVENSQAQRVADHALEIKAKLEAQLVEWGGLLAGLGLEPPAKRRDVGRRMSSGSRGSMGRRSPRKSLRDLAREAEARAREEGRLTPIREHKSYPRRTMDEEIMALRNEAEAEAADISGSSDIGPPPTSRYAEPESPQKDPDSPSKPPQREETHEEPHEETYDEAPESIPESPLKPPSPTPVTIKEEETDAPSVDTLSDVPQAETATVQNTQPERASKAGAKRKLAARDDSENLVPDLASAPSATTRKKATIVKERTSAGNKALKDVTASKRDEMVKQGPVAQAPALRKPLSAKSTNDDLMSPKKNTRKAAGEKPLRPARAKALPEKQAKEPSKRRLTVLDEQVALPPAEPPIKVTTIPEPEPEPQKPAEPTIITPDPETHLSPTPEPKSNRQSRDTPPPADISSSGETSRPSRRSRSQVSYAEPNLRDKMRRPSKQLVDAVIENRGRRSESLAAEDFAAMGEGVKRESDGVESLGGVEQADPPEEHAAEAPRSPLARKGLESLPSSVVTERRKRRSSVLAREFLAENASQNFHDDSLDSSMSSVATTDNSVDIYDFPANSPEADVVETAPKKTSSRRASRAGHELSRGEEEARPSRKRASMNVPRRPKLEGTEGGDAVVEGPRDRSMRRRSTML